MQKRTPFQLVATLFLVFALLLPSLASAQMLGGEDAWWRDGEVDRDTDDDQGQVEEDDDRNDRRYSGSLKSKINRLPDDRVDELPIPVLFGLTLDDIWPSFGDARGGETRLHEGLDILAPEGTPIVSPTEAVVIGKGTWSGAGLYVVTANPGGEEFSYMHLDAIADIRRGDVLDTGDLIGYVGDTGNAKGGPAHLHFEIERKGKVRDPYPRIQAEFSLSEKIDYLEEIFDDHNDDEDFVEFLAESFLGEFLQAQGQGIDLPRELARALENMPGIDELGTRDLELGDEGPDVQALQTVLIAQGHLALSTPTDYFGPLTQVALIKYQTQAGIQPASGYFGPVTRSVMQGGRTSQKLAVAEVDSELVQLIRLLIALEIISPDKEEQALRAIQTL